MAYVPFGSNPAPKNKTSAPGVTPTTVSFVGVIVIDGDAMGLAAITTLANNTNNSGIVMRM